MKKSAKTKVITSSLAATLLLGIAAPLPLQAKAATTAATSSTDADATQKLTAEEIQELIQVQNELKEKGITADDIIKGIEAELPEGTVSGQTGTSGGTMTTMGVKSQAAKVAAKQMVKKLGKIGRVSWDRTVTTYINKLPVSKGTKTGLKKYLKYQFVMSALNTVIGFSGTIITGLSNQFQKMGMPKWLSDMAARVVVGILL